MIKVFTLYITLPLFLLLALLWIIKGIQPSINRSTWFELGNPEKLSQEEINGESTYSITLKTGGASWYIRGEWENTFNKITAENPFKNDYPISSIKCRNDKIYISRIPFQHLIENKYKLINLINTANQAYFIDEPKARKHAERQWKQKEKKMKEKWND